MLVRRLSDRSRLLAALVALAALLLAYVPTMADAGESSARVSDELVAWATTATADETERVIVTYHDAADVDRVTSYAHAATTLSHLPMAIAVMDAGQIEEAATDPAVRSVWHDEANELHLEDSVPMTGAPDVWEGRDLESGYTGAGVGVGVVDTGVDGLHPDLPYPEKVEPYVLIGDTEDPDLVWMFESPTGDTYGHGTHVSSTVAGLGEASDGTHVGMAPDAHIYSFKTDVGLFLYSAYILKSFDWMLEHRGENNIRISTNSWGSGGGSDFDPDHPVNVATKELFDNGITVIFSAGNGGEPDSLNQYAVAPWVIGVAANDKDRELASFSSRGRIDDNWDRRTAWRTGTGVYRPTLSAPGVGIVAARSTQTTVMSLGTQVDNPLYTSAQGTSMSAPHVAGAVALMYEANPDLTPEQIISILEHTADEMSGYEMFEVGAGHLNAHAAVEIAEGKRRGFPPLVRGQGGTFTELDTSPGDYDGLVLTNTYEFRDCHSDDELLNYHRVEVTDDVDLLYAELEWEDEQQLIYLFIYDEDCNEVASSAGLLDLVFTTNRRALVVSNPDQGVWTIAVYGRVNVPTEYRGEILYYEEN